MDPTFHGLETTRGDASILIVPVLHDRLEFADEVRAAFAAWRPDAVAVEVPSTLDRLWTRAIDRLPTISVILFETEDGATIYLPVHPADPLAEASRSARAAGVPVRCADLDVDGYADHRDPMPDGYAVRRLGARAVVEAALDVPRPRDPADDRREAAMAFHVGQAVAEGARRVMLVCGLHHARAVVAAVARDQAAPLTPPRRRNARLVHLHPESVAEVLVETPFHVAAREALRDGMPESPPERAGVATSARHHGPFRVLHGGRESDEHALEDALRRTARAAAVPVPGATPRLCYDRLAAQQALHREAERALAAVAPDEEVRSWQRSNLARFGRNLALASGRLLPDLFDTLVAARGCVSENYAYELHALATAYPAQRDAHGGLPVARIRADEMYDGTRAIRLRRRVRREKRPDWRSLFRARRERERFPGEWLTGFDSNDICSYPPEDIVVEDFGRYLRHRGKSVLSEERARTSPFTTSIMDGIDVRETIRRWSEGRIWVRELGRVPGAVGSVVVIFDEDEAAYPYEQTWLGEHDQESDMAFFSTEPAQGVVGPGICRVTYGGFLLSRPPRRMLDVWSDPDYRIAETRAETLLLAALDYSSDRLVAHVAPRPPRPILRQLAGRLGLKLIHLPLGTLSPATLRRIRVMHILSGHDKRAIARDYVW